MLGFKRDKDFIKWDWDVELGFFENNFINNFKKIKQILQKKNFKIIYENLSNRKIEFYKYRPPNITKFTLRAWKFDYFTQNYIRNRLNVQKKFYKNITKIKYGNRYFNCPGPVNEFLEYFYGNWRIPIQTANKEKYLSKKLYRKNFWSIYLIFNKLKSKIF